MEMEMESKHRDLVESKHGALVESDGDLFSFIESHLNRTHYVQSNVNRLGVRPDTMVVYFRDFKTRKDAFHIELQKSDTCSDVLVRVADQLEIDKFRIRLRVHDCFCQQPQDELIDYRCGDYLWDKLLMWDKVSDICYYEVLEKPLHELEKLRTLYVELGYPRYTMVKLLLPKASTIADLLIEVKERMLTRLSNPDAELRLLGIAYGKICQILHPDDKIETIPNYSKLRAEEVPEEDKNLGPSSFLIRTYHFTKEGAAGINGEIFGDPFLLIIKEDEKLVDVKERLAKKLKLALDELSKWKFQLLRMTGSNYYIQDTDVLWSCFEEKGPWVQLGMEHSEVDF